MKPLTSVRNFVPSSTDDGSPSSTGFGGTVDALQIEQGHVRDSVTETATPAPGVSRLPVSSYARLLIVTLPFPAAVQLYVQLDPPVAAFHVVPPSVETSTPATTPPPVSLAVPLI